MVRQLLIRGVTLLEAPGRPPRRADVLLEEGRRRGCKLLKWQIIDTNTEALKFYAAQEATIENNWLNGKLFL